MRQIELELFDWIDDKLAKNGLAQHAMLVKDGRFVFGCAMESCVGIYEIGGNNNGPMVRLIQKTIGEANREPWCMGLVQSCIAYTEKKLGITSAVFPSEHCMTVWRNTPIEWRVKVSPLRGAVVIWNREGTDQGHTGMVLEHNQLQMTTIEGNTGSNGSRDGDGVYRKRRSKIRDGELKVIGWLKPF